jgi:signal transduction histidine kinase
MDPLKIILLEDFPDDVDLVRYILQKEGMSFVLRSADTRNDFIKLLSEFIPDVVLSDHSMPQFNSIEALRLCKSVELQVPFILVTGTVSEEFAVQCLREGADDYVLKSNLTRLPSAIIGALRKKEEEYSRKKAENALLYQNQELTKVNAELDRFVYSVSHNIRAPLMSVLGLLNLAQHDLKTKNSDQYGNYFSMMEGSIYKLDETLKEIIDYSRNSRTEIRRDLLDVRELVEEAFQNLIYVQGAEFIEKKITMEGSPLIYSDRLRLSVIFNNLLSNAIKYRDRDKTKNYIHVLLQTQRDLYITVSDNGIGIRPEYLVRIFDMFFRATEKGDGSGLGLYIVKETLEKMEGTIAVNSEFGEGTTFSMSLPVFSSNPELQEVKE